MRKKISVLLLSIAMIFCSAFGLLKIANVQPVTINAAAATTVDLKTAATLHDWNDADNTGCEFLPFCIGSPNSNTLLPGWSGWYNDGIAGKLQYNNNLDPLEYVYVNDTSFRDLVTANVKAADKYLSSNTNSPLSWASGWFGPVSIETNTAYGILIRIMNEFITDVIAEEGKFILTFKQGFALVGQNDTTYTMSADRSYSYCVIDGSWTEMTATGTLTDVTSAVTMVFGHTSSGGDNVAYMEMKFGEYSLLPAQGDGGVAAGATSFFVNDHPKVNAMDFMNFVYINGVSARSIVEANLAGTTTYKHASQFPMSNGGRYAPVTVVVNGTFLSVRVMNEYADPANGITYTLKSGFTWTNTSGQMLYTTHDITYRYTTSGFVRVYNEVELSGNAVLRDWSDAESDNCEFLPYSIGNPGATNTFKPIAALKNIYWNDGIDGKKANNGGVDLMEYIYINDRSARSIVNDNATNKTYTGTGFPMTLGGVYAPVTVQTNDTYGILVKIYDNYITDLLASEGRVVLTLKAGLSLLGENDIKYCLSQDVRAAYISSSDSWTQSFYILSFEGTDSAVNPIVVTPGAAMSNLPAVPEKEGYTGVWKIDGSEVTTSTVYNYGADKTATAVYTGSTSIEEINISDLGNIVDWNNAESDDMEYLPFVYMVDGANALKPATALKGIFWNDNVATKKANNDGQDIMEYIYFNGKSARQIVNENIAGTTSYIGTTGVSSYGPTFAPILVLNDDSIGIAIKVMYSYLDDLLASEGKVLLTYKAGLRLLGDNNNAFYFGNDVSYAYVGGTWVKDYYTLSFEGTDSAMKSIYVKANAAMSDLPAVPEKEGCVGVWTIDGAEVNATTVYSYGADKTATAKYYEPTDVTDDLVLHNWADDQGVKRIPLTIPDEEGDNSMIPNGFTFTYWNDHPENAAINFGLDLMQYVLFNGVDTRTLVNNNKNGVTSYAGGFSPLSIGGIYAPMTVEYGPALGVYVCVLADYIDDLMEKDGYVLLTYKEGLSLRGDGVIYTITEDMHFMYENGAWVRKYAVTLTGELATGADSAVIYVTANETLAYPTEYSKTQAGDETTTYVYNWYLGEELYMFNVPVTEHFTLTADGTFTEYSSYTVTINDGTTTSTQVVGEGMTIAQPADPTKEETSEYRYVFNGWYNGDTKWDFATPITEDTTLTAKFDAFKKIVLSDLYKEGETTEALKTGEVEIVNSAGFCNGYIGSSNSNYFDLSFEFSFTSDLDFSTFDVKITDTAFSNNEESSFFVAWHIYYARKAAGTYYMEYQIYDAETGKRSTIQGVQGPACGTINTIYQANFAYRIVDAATGTIEMYSNIAGWEETFTHALGAEYIAKAANYDRLVISTESSGNVDVNFTFADPGLTGAAHYDITLYNGSEVFATASTNQITLPTMDNVAVEGELTQVFVGWTTNVSTLPNLYPAGYKLQLEGATNLYAVWIGFDLEDGAGVRLSSDSAGIRFTTQVDRVGYQALRKYVTSTGTLFVPAEYLTKATFVHSSFGTGQYVDVATAKWRQSGESDATWKYSAALVNMSASQYARVLAARGYLKVNYTSGSGYVYTPYNETDNARSMYQIATSAYNDTNTSYSSNAMILNYVNSVADIDLSDVMGLSKNGNAVGAYDVSSSSLSESTFTVTLSNNVSGAVVNGTRIVAGAAKNVQIGDFIFSISDVTISGTQLTFTVGAAADLNDKYTDGNTYFRSSDAELDLFLNDYFTRHSTGIYKNGVDQKVNSVVAGENANEFFWWEWFSTAYYSLDTDTNSLDRIEGLREKLVSVPIDDYGYVWQNTDAVRGTDSTWATGEHRMGWPFPTAEHLVVKEDIRTSFLGSTTTYITAGYTTSWDFNGADRTNWSSNISASNQGGLFKGTASGASSVTFTSPTLPQSRTVKKYTGFSSKTVTVYDEPAIYTYYSPLLELDVRMSNADNVKDIVVHFTNNSGTTSSISVNEYAFIKYDYSGAYEHMIFLPMYAHEDWAGSKDSGRYITNLSVEIVPEDGMTLTGEFSLNYVRPTLDTRHTNNNSIFISSLRQDYDYTNDLAFLEQNIDRARKAMTFLMQNYNQNDCLMQSSYLVGHDGDKTGNNLPERIASSLGNGYWDISYMPEYDFHSNSYFYKAAADMAYLEQILRDNNSQYADGDASVQTAVRHDHEYFSDEIGAGGFGENLYSDWNLEGIVEDTLNSLRATIDDGTNLGFWDETKGRFVAGWGDAGGDGTSEWVDYGYVVWNLEAIYYGIATDKQAEQIMSWISGERIIEGDTSTGADLYFFQLAPRSTTYQGTSATDKSVFTGMWYTQGAVTYGKNQVQHGGAIMYTTYYDLMSRIQVKGADDAFARLKGIEDWYMDIYNWYQTSGATPDDFYWEYYENRNWDSNGDGVGEYWQIQNGIKGNNERENKDAGGVIGIDGEFLESVLPLAAIPYGFFGVESLGSGTLQIAPKLPSDLDHWTAENFTFGGCKYDLTIYDSALQISSVRGETEGLTLKAVFDVPETEYTVYVNGFATTNYTVVDGQIVVEIPFGNVVVEIR